MATIATTKPEITTIPFDQIHPNPWNPNRMAEEQAQEYVEEVRRLERLPKPVVVRKKEEDRYEIIDGEHGWRAAGELGFEEVLCEVVEVDDFTARLETLKRNQHGDHNKLLEGRMFVEMIEIRGINQSRLAEEHGIAEGTIRNSLDYVKAADLRKEYLREHGPAPIHMR